MSELLGKMGLDKATGPDDPTIEAVKIVAKQYIRCVVEAMNQVLQQGIPEIKYGGRARWCRYTEENEIC